MRQQKIERVEKEVCFGFGLNLRNDADFYFAGTLSEGVRIVSHSTV